MNRREYINYFILLLAFIMAGCNTCNKKKGTAAQPDKIQIGCISVFSGDGANYGTTAKTAVEMAVNEINAAGGVQGKKIEIIYEDDKGETKDAVTAFQKLASVNKVPAVIGPFYSGQVLACAPQADRSKVVLISGSATSDNISKSGEFVFRTCPTNLEQGKTIAQFCYNDLKKKNAFIIYRNADYGVTLKDRFKSEYEKLGGVVTGETAIEPDAKDAKSQLNKIKQAKADLLFIPVHYPEGGILLKQAKEMGIKAIFIGGDGGYDPQLIEIAGNGADNSYWATIGWGSSDTKVLTDSFIAKYKKLYNIEPGVYSGLYYDAVKVLAEAIGKCDINKLSGEAIKSALMNIKNYRGATGTLTFNADGDVEKPFSIYKISNKQFQIIK